MTSVSWLITVSVYRSLSFHINLWSVIPNGRAKTIADIALEFQACEFFPYSFLPKLLKDFPEVT